MVVLRAFHPWQRKTQRSCRWVGRASRWRHNKLDKLDGMQHEVEQRGWVVQANRS